MSHRILLVAVQAASWLAAAACAQAADITPPPAYPPPAAYAPAPYYAPPPPAYGPPAYVVPAPCGRRWQCGPWGCGWRPLCAPEAFVRPYRGYPLPARPGYYGPY